MAQSKKVAERLATFTHYTTAFVILMKGITKAEHFHGHELTVIFLFAAALYIAAGTALHHRFHGRSGELLQASFYGLESVVLFMIGRFAAAEGKQLLPYVFYVAAAGFAVALVVRVIVAFRTGSAPAEPA